MSRRGPGRLAAVPGLELAPVVEAEEEAREADVPPPPGPGVDSGLGLEPIPYLVRLVPPRP